jgi:hypothetical protein
MPGGAEHVPVALPRQTGLAAMVAVGRAGEYLSGGAEWKAWGSGRALQVFGGHGKRIIRCW